MDTTAQSLVRAADDDQCLLLLAFDRFRFCFVEDSVGGLAVLAGLSHRFLGAGEFGRGDDFHGLSDFLDVADGFEAAFDFAEGGVVGILRLDGGKSSGRGSGGAMAMSVFVSLPKSSSCWGFDEPSYRSVADVPARKAGRAALDNMTAAARRVEMGMGA